MVGPGGTGKADLGSGDDSSQVDLARLGRGSPGPEGISKASWVYFASFSPNMS